MVQKSLETSQKGLCSSCGQKKKHTPDTGLMTEKLMDSPWGRIEKLIQVNVQAVCKKLFRLWAEMLMGHRHKGDALAIFGRKVQVV